MSLWASLRVRLRELRDAPLRSLNRGERALRYLYDLTRYCARNLKRDRADQLAAALTYRTLFSLLPMLALALVVLQAFAGQAAKDEFKQTLIDWVATPLRPDGAEPLAESDDLLLGDGDPEALPAPTGRDRFADAQHALAERFEEITDALAAIDFTSVGIFGFLLFLYAATGLLQTIEQSCDQVYKARRRRPLHRRVPLYYTVVTLGPVIILGGLYLRGAIVDALEAETLTRWLGGLLIYLSPLLSAWLVLFIVFFAVPNTRVEPRPAAIGALSAAVLVGIASELFRVYVANAAVASLYGALALMPLFLLWLYLVWLLVLFGLEVSFALQTVHDRDWSEAEQQAVRPIEDYWALPLVVLVARAFERGGVTDTQALANSLDLPISAVRRLTESLVEGGFVREIEVSGRQGLTLARPAQQIGMDALLDAVSPLPMFQDDEITDEALHRFLASLHHAAIDKAQGRTLAEFAGEPERLGSDGADEPSV